MIGDMPPIDIDFPLYSLPDELRPQFEAIVEDWNAVAFETGPSAHPYYRVLAELVKAGWRKPTCP
jgi:hypothetical protein